MKKMFQSLIGTLQTCSHEVIAVTNIPVSIPYRYATNVYNAYLNASQAWVSIPYRYATNQDTMRMLQDFAVVSIPYRYATNMFNKGGDI